MANTIEPLEENDAPKIVEAEGTDSAGDKSENRRQDIFDAQFQTLMDGFGEACETHHVETAIAIAKHPEKDEPIVFFRGHLIDAATLAASVLRQIKRQLDEQLNTNPR